MPYTAATKATSANAKRRTMGDVARRGSTKWARPGWKRRRLFLVKLTAIVGVEEPKLALAPIVRGAIATVALALALPVACGGSSAPPPAQPRPAVRVVGPPAPLPAWTYWEAV